MFFIPICVCKRGVQISLPVACLPACLLFEEYSLYYFHYPMDSVVCFVNSYPLDSDVWVDSVIHALHNKQ